MDVRIGRGWRRGGGGPRTVLVALLDRRERQRRVLQEWTGARALGGENSRGDVAQREIWIGSCRESPGEGDGDCGMQPVPDGEPGAPPLDLGFGKQRATGRKLWLDGLLLTPESASSMLLVLIPTNAELTQANS